MQIIVLLQPRASDAGFYSFLRIGAVSWASLTAKDSDVDWRMDVWWVCARLAKSRPRRIGTIILLSVFLQYLRAQVVLFASTIETGFTGRNYRKRKGNGVLL